MAITLKLEHKGTEYTLEYTKKMVARLAREGVTPEAMSGNSARALDIIPTMFAGAFVKHHPRVKQETVNEIYELIEKKEDLLVALAEMYNEPLGALMDEPENDSAKITWERSEG